MLDVHHALVLFLSNVFSAKGLWLICNALANKANFSIQVNALIASKDALNVKIL